MMTDEDKRILDLKAATVVALRVAYLKAADRRQVYLASAIWNQYATHLNEYRQMKRRMK